MKLVDVYTEWRVVAGVALIVLGAVNWAIGLDRTQQYSHILAQTPKVGADQAYRSFDELDARSDTAVLAPFSSEQRRVSYATARMDFYHATYLTGQALVMVGVVLALVGFIILIQRDSRRANQRLRGSIGGHAPPAQ
jgi:energy-converting hydrogenase Eha subunit E